MDKQYDQLLSEQECQKKWANQKTYDMAHHQGPLYSIDTPPPTVSGSLHIGHIFSYTQTDIIARYKRMSGFCVYYPFGFDDNGLPTERYVEKKRDIQAHTLKRTDFIKICLEETHAVEEQFIALWQRMGLSVNWDYCYSTIAPLARKLSQESFIELYKKGFIYRRHEPALYCTVCRTSVAQAELDDAQKPSFFNDIVFKDSKGNDLIIGTTRPELLPSCVALLYNPADKRYVHLKGTQATVPLFGFTVPILEDERVSVEKGTGLVMCCTFGDKTDIEWYKKFKLPYKQSIGLDGRMASTAGFLAGLKVIEARTKVIEELRNQNLLIKQQEMSHNVSVHERCKKEIEFIALEQWFINILDHKQIFLDLADKITWYPAFMKTRYRDWVTNLNWDWCISRQRFFGIPFPVWYCSSCKTIVLPEIKDLPLDPQEQLYKGTCPNCSGADFIPDTDVMDTWNTSAITPYICAALFNHADAAKASINQKEIVAFIPMNMRPQAHDIIRTWAFDTIVKTWMHQQSIPWHSIVISGHVLSNSKEKLSKSKENASLTPEGLLKNYSADAIRYWTASGSLGHDVSFSDNQLKIGGRLITKLWNAFKFINEHIGTLEQPHKQPAHLSLVHEWILHNASQTFNHYQAYFDKNEFGLALGPIEKFFWTDFCDNYLELVKHQLFNPQEYTEQEVEATRWTLYHCGLRILQFFCPYLPHSTETIYGHLYQRTQSAPSIHQTKFSVTQQNYQFSESAHLMSGIIELISAVRKLKTDRQLSLKTPLATLTILTDTTEIIDQLKKHKRLICGVTQAVELCYQSGTDKALLIEENGSWHATVPWQS